MDLGLIIVSVMFNQMLVIWCKRKHFSLTKALFFIGGLNFIYVLSFEIFVRESKNDVLQIMVNAALASLSFTIISTIAYKIAKK